MILYYILRKFREARNHTQEDTAFNCGMSASSSRQIERNADKFAFETKKNKATFMIKSTVLIVLFSILFIQKTYSQDIDTLDLKIKENSRKGMALYVNYPIGIMLNHIRLKAAYRTSEKHSFILSFTKYYKIFPSSQIYAEYQYNLLNTDKAEWLIYTKVGVGDYSYREMRTEFAFDNPNSNGSYYLFGTGVAHEYCLGKSKRFLVQFSEGLKLVKPFNYNTAPEKDFGWLGFLFWGPGAIADININFGYKF